MRAARAASPRENWLKIREGGRLRTIAVDPADAGDRTCLPVDALPQPKRDLGYVE
jgi:hypothetical protein